jgi:ADP-heptose:LPS heptosyltransferase
MAVEIVILGGKKDWASAEGARVEASAGCNACGMLSLEESAALLHMCTLAICVDRGPMHPAGALGTPCVVPFSRMNKQLDRWFPLGTGHTTLYRDVNCAGCRLTECEVEGHPCISGISTDQIVAAVARKLNSESVSREVVNGTSFLEWPPTSELQPC